MYDPVLKDTVDKVLVTFSDGKVNGYLADEWDNMMTQVDSMLEKASMLEPKASQTTVRLTLACPNSLLFVFASTVFATGTNPFNFR
jgi:hypothetical protein